MVGSGPNGLAAAVSLARAGYAVRVLEASPEPGGGIRTAPGPLAGFRYDTCSAVHPLLFTSPFFRAFGIRQKIHWHIPEISYAHPLDGESAAIAWRDLDRTCADLGADGDRWSWLMRPLSTRLDDVVRITGDQLLRLPSPVTTAVRLGSRVAVAGSALGRLFSSEAAAALLAGAMAHANAPLPSLAAAGAGLLLAAHAHGEDGWGFPHGGSGQIARALIDDLTAHGGVVDTDVHVRSLADLTWGDARRGDLLVLDTTPRMLLSHPDVAGGYARAIRRYRNGPGVAKVDFALDGPVPWRDERVGRAPTVHIGGSAADILASERAVSDGRIHARPYVLVVQPSVLDDSRAPEGHGTLWAYIHVPAGSGVDPTELITAQIERFAPGFRARIRAAQPMSAAARAGVNPNDIGGDVLGGAVTLRQLVKRPVVSRTPWRTPLPGVYLASSSTPPGPGVTGMPGWRAVRQALRDAGSPVELDDLF